MTANSGPLWHSPIRRSWAAWIAGPCSGAKAARLSARVSMPSSRSHRPCATVPSHLTPRELAMVAAMLSSPANGLITGANYRVDGGPVRGLH